jgi:predicted RNA-binding protein Jag
MKAQARAGTRVFGQDTPAPVNLADYRIRRKAILGDLTHEYQIAA